MSSTVETVIRVAEKEVGYTEGTSHGVHDNDTKYADEVPGLEWADFQPWCATFVSWVARKAGVAALYPRTASCDEAARWFKARKRWSDYPAVGAQVFYGTARDLDHTGIVVDYDATHITTIEGNTNDDGGREGTSVMRKDRLRRSPRVVGYGYPRFPEGLRSADPAYGVPHAVPHAAARTGPHPARQPVRGTGALTVDGVDLSHWQDGRLDLTAARRAGVRFVVHKATEGTGVRDERHDRRRADVAAAGLLWGAYHFARPSASSGAKQAQFLLSRARPQAGDLRPVLDLEKDGGLSPQQLAAWAQDFCEEVRMRLHVEPIVYTPFDLPGPLGALGPLWVARYSGTNAAPRVPRPWKDYAIWQFSDGTHGHPDTVPGIGHCDLDTLAPGTRLETLRLP
jgi:GH25 family lysozyme M1 (1,4-beta-N-acetylmuramidase)